jgi:xylulokinase
MLKSNLDYLGLDVEEIRAMGGGANSPFWCQMKADMTGKRLVTLKNKETACLGSAILAGVGTGVFESVEQAAKVIELDKIFESKGTDYTECYERYLNYDKILNI